MKKMLRAGMLAGLSLALYAGSALASGAITPSEVSTAQQKWGGCIVKIGKAADQAAAKAAAAACINDLYAYDNGGVLFKPTKAAANQFRLKKDEALSYFVKGIVPQDHGFALQPWSKVRFENAKTLTDSDSGLAMGNYYFTDAKTGKEVKVEYTFGYIKDKKGKVRINLHHSSLPYQPAH
jgi:hypothetical protein